MTTHLTADQIRWWLDDDVVQDVLSHTEAETEFNLQVTLSKLPIHLVKVDERGPLRVVGQSGFDTERSRRLLRDGDSRGELLEQLGPVLASTPGFYTFLDEEDRATELRDAERLQFEHRIYPDEASQQALMDSLMAIATGMRFVQNVVAATRPDDRAGGESRPGDGS
jgi:hypothetical protein